MITVIKNYLKKTLWPTALAAIVLAAVLAAPFSSAAPAAYAAAVPDALVRVQLSSYGEPASFNMKATGTYKIEDNGKPLSGAFTVKANSKGILITAGSNSWQLDGDVLVTAGSASVSNQIQINSGYSYAGDLRIIQKGSGLKLVNQLAIDTYVAGVLPYEMSNAWPAEALKAQAVAARTYAYFKMKQIDRAGTEQDITNGGNDQTYLGYNASYANCVKAAQDTAGQILKTPSGGAVYACFSASNGGYTEYPKSSGAATTNFDYLPFKADSYDLAISLSSAAYGATVSIPKTLTAANLKTSGAQPYKFLREKLNAEGVDVSSLASDVTVIDIKLTNPRYTSPDRAWLGANVTLSLPKTAAAAARDITLDFGPYMPAGSTAKYPFLNGTLGLGTRYGMLFLRDDGASWLLAAVRVGHASGMSQVGAYQIANNGGTYKDILTFYFNLGSATKLVTLSGSGTAVSVPGSSGNTDTADNGSQTAAATQTGTVKVAAGQVLNVRAGAGADTKILGTLNNGAKVTITGSSGDWYKITYNGATAYVNKAYITAVTSAPAASGSSGSGSSAAAVTQTGKVKVAAGQVLNVRAGAGTNTKILGTLNNGAKVTITGTKGDWYKITYNGAKAYVNKAYIKVVKNTPAIATQTGTVKVAAGQGLNVRAGAGTNTAILGILYNGAKVTITGTSGDWYKITYNGAAAYVNKAYVVV